MGDEVEPVPKKIEYTQLCPNDFGLFGAEIMKREPPGVHGPSYTFDRRFRSTFGTSSDVCSVLWNMLQPYTTMHQNGIVPHHLLWSLMFLKEYAHETVHCAMVGGVDEKTFRKWSWLFVDAISFLEPMVVSVLMIVVYFCAS